MRRVLTLLQEGHPRAALAHAREALLSGRATALLPDLCHLGGIAANALGDDTTAEAMWRDAVDADPDLAESWLQLGALLATQRRHEDAASCLRAGLALAPARAAEHDRLGLILMRLARAPEAEACHRRAAALDPQDPAAWTHLGFALEAQERHAEALEAHRRALARAPLHASVHSNLGNVLARLGDFEAAEHHHREAVRIDPAVAAAQANLGVLLADLRRDAEAATHLQTAIALRPGYPLARLNLGFLRLAQGRFAEGWPLHEARHDPSLPDCGIAPPPGSMPAWQGEPLAGRSVLVWPEQGFGDQIQFCRHAPLLKVQGAGRVTLVCQRPLFALFETLAGIDRLVPADVVDNAFSTGEVDLSDHDVWTYAMTLPLHSRTELASVPASIPYLRATHAAGGAAATSPAPRVARRPGRRIGLVWRGNPRHHNDADRSLPGLATLAPLWSVPGLSFVSLQTGAASHEARRPPTSQPLDHIDLQDFASTAHALTQVDLLICVDTSIAHLAGALGVACWVLLPEHRTDWRWLRDRDDSPWYPGVMRLFRQAARGDWGGVVERVRRALEEGSR